MESCLSSFIESDICTNGIANKLFSQHSGFYFVGNTLRISFSLIGYTFENITFSATIISKRRLSGALRAHTEFWAHDSQIAEVTSFLVGRSQRSLLSGAVWSDPILAGTQPGNPSHPYIPYNLNSFHKIVSSIAYSLFAPIFDTSQSFKRLYVPPYYWSHCFLHCGSRRIFYVYLSNASRSQQHINVNLVNRSRSCTRWLLKTPYDFLFGANLRAWTDNVSVWADEPA